MKKTISLLMSLAMILTSVLCFNISAFASDVSDFDYYVRSNGDVEITDYYGGDTDLVIPSHIDGKEVKIIGSYAFHYYGLTSVTLPDTIVEIEDCAFLGNDFTTITIPKNVSKIHSESFYQCSELREIIVDSENKSYCSEDGVLFNYDKTELVVFPEGNTIKSYTIPNTVNKIGDNAFVCNVLESITIPDSVTSIGSYAFYNSYCLKEIQISKYVEYIGDNAFLDDRSLEKIDVDADNKNYCSDNGVLFNKKKTELIKCPSCLGEDDEDVENVYNIPDGVEIICEDAFRNTYFKSVIFPESVEKIMDYAFSSMYYLTEIEIGNGVNYIGENAFYHSYSLETLIIPSSVTKVEECAFCDLYSLKSVYYKDSEDAWNNIDFGEDVFKGCNAYQLHFDYCTSTTEHSYKFKESVSANCYSYGYDKYICENCGNVHKEFSDEEKEFVHTDLKKTVIKPTCTTQGYTIYSCGDCELVYRSDFVKATGHTYKTTTTKATLSQNGTIVKTCSICGKKTTTTIYSPKTISLSTTSYTYNGNVRKPVVTVKDSKGNTLKNGTDYTLTYASGRKNVGKYSVKVTFKGNYSGSKTLYFTIKPKSTSISKLTAKSKGFTVKWNKQATQTTGYQIQYSTSSSFSNAKTVTVSKNSTTSKTISSLTKNKKYYVRVRTYKTVNNTKYYSAWSSAKSVKTK